MAESALEPAPRDERPLSVGSNDMPDKRCVSRQSLVQKLAHKKIERPKVMRLLPSFARGGYKEPAPVSIYKPVQDVTTLTSQEH